jgi:XTP/dITP diphosphohydrolase
MRSLLLGTRNPGKLKEILSILEAAGWSFTSLQEFEDVEPPEEGGETYSENAIIKARHYAAATGKYALADDSGLEVEALGGAPGVLSARYAGANAEDSDRRELLLSELAKTGDKDRRARFVAVVAIASPDGTILNVSEGVCEGVITSVALGTGGFGYDPLFIPEGHDQTFAELPEEIKNRISHRGRALMKTNAFLRSFNQT